MNRYMIVTNDVYELLVAQDLIGAKAVAEYLGLSINRVRKNLCTGIWNHKAKYKAVPSENVALGGHERMQRQRERVKRYDMTHDRSEYFRRHYQKKKQEKIMGELFMRYPINSVVEHEGRKCRILGYETYSDKRYLVCMDGNVECRIDVEAVEHQLCK